MFSIPEGWVVELHHILIEVHDRAVIIHRGDETGDPDLLPTIDVPQDQCDFRRWDEFFNHHPVSEEGDSLAFVPAFPTENARRGLPLGSVDPPVILVLGIRIAWSCLVNNPDLVNLYRV